MVVVVGAAVVVGAFVVFGASVVVVVDLVTLRYETASFAGAVRVHAVLT